MVRRSSLALTALAALLAAALLAAAWWGLRPRSAPLAAGLSLAEAMGGGAEGYLRAVEPRPFSFPTDHGPHPGFRTEWWYFTGNLSGPEGEAYGFHLTFFRSALRPPAARSEGDSAWRADDLYMAHFALADERGGRFRHAERFARAAIGLAGAESAPLRVWLEDWSAAAEPDAGPEGIPPLRLRAREGSLALDLRLERGKPPVLQGDRGLSQKGPEPGNASHYYSLTRLPARGTLALDGREIAVTGSAWMDREWSTSALGEEVAGWDWFALQLDDGRDLMLYRLRREDGTADPWSKGSLVAADGSARTLTAEEFVLAPLATWTSPATGAAYPVRWRIALPAEGLELTVAPRLEAQEMQVAVRYWEGAVTVRGRDPSGPVAGHGFLEMTGYAPEALAGERGRAASAAASRTGG